MKKQSQFVYLPLLMVAALSFLTGCGSSDPKSSCESACSLEEGATCYERQAECNSKCVAYVAQIQSKSNAECASCVATRFSYSIDPADKAKCWGVQPPLSEDDAAACSAICTPAE